MQRHIRDWKMLGILNKVYASLSQYYLTRKRKICREKNWTQGNEQIFFFFTAPRTEKNNFFKKANNTI